MFIEFRYILLRLNPIYSDHFAPQERWRESKVVFLFHKSMSNPMAAKKKATRKKAKVQVESDQRKYARHVNRVLCQYLMIQCWVRGYDEVVIRDSWLREFYGVEALRNERIRWLVEDSKPWFVCKKEKRGELYDSEWGELRTYYWREFSLLRRRGHSGEDDSVTLGRFHYKWQEPSLGKMELYLSQIALGSKPLRGPYKRRE